MFRIHLTITLLLAMLGTAWASPADKQVERLLESMRTAYRAVQSASLEITSKIDIEGKQESQAVSMHYQRPNLLRLAFTFRGQVVTRISDGKKVHTMGEKGDPFTINYSIDAMGSDSPINLEALSFFDWKRQLSTSPGANMEKSKFKLIESERWNDRTWLVLEETAHGQNVFVRYFIDPQSFLIWRCEVRSLDKKSFIMETEVRTMVLNSKLDPKLFVAPKRKPQPSSSP